MSDGKNTETFGMQRLQRELQRHFLQEMTQIAARNLPSDAYMASAKRTCQVCGVRLDSLDELACRRKQVAEKPAVLPQLLLGVEDDVLHLLEPV